MSGGGMRHAAGMSQDNLIEAVTNGGGVMRVERLRELGFRRTLLESVLAAGRLQRVRRGWVALPNVDPLLASAARRGVVLTCITQARRLGLWVHETPAAAHVGATPGSAGGKPDTIRVHWARPLLPRHPDSLVDPIENVLAIVAECEPHEQALATWDSALNKGLVTLEGLAGYDWRPAARRLLGEATPFSDAGLETYLRPRLRWLRHPIRIQTWIAGHRVDALIGERLVLQIDGAHHVGQQRSEDIRHDAELRLMGYHVVRISYHQMMHEWALVQDLIMRAVAQGLHLASRRRA